MAGPHVATSVAFLTLGVTILNIARDVVWPKSVPTPEWLGQVLLVIGGLFILLAFAVVASAFERGPIRMRQMIDKWLSSEETPPYPDMPILDVVRRVCPHVGGKEDISGVPEGEWDRLSKLLHELREHGRLGRLTIWGRHKAMGGFEESTPRSAIPPEFWEKGDLDYLELIRDWKGKAELSNWKEKEWYDDIWFSRKQVNRVYPPARTGIRLQKPWTRIETEPTR